MFVLHPPHLMLNPRPPSHTSVFGDKASKEVRGLSKLVRVGAGSDEISVLTRRNTRELCVSSSFSLFLSIHACSEEKPCEDIVERQTSTSQDRKSHQKPILRASQPWTPRIQSYEKIHFYCVSQSVQGFAMAVQTD